jgi:hypothetical protein
MDTTKISNIVIEGIDHTDHPDYSDAFIASADLDGVEMDDKQLDELNNNYDFVYDSVLNWVY